jgi:TolA-binding protein
LASLAVVVFCSPAAAQVITDLGLERNHQVSRLWLQADAPLVYQVELSDPQTVVVHLRDAKLGADLPQPEANDPIVSRLNYHSAPDGLSIVLYTRSPGITVLPFYEAAQRRLTLELGGAPSLQVEVPMEPAAAPASQPRPEPEAKAPEQPPAPAAQPEKPKAAPPSGPPPQVAAVRLGSHADFTRIVLDGRGQLAPELAIDGARVVLSLARGVLAPNARRDPPDERVRQMKIASTRPLRLELTLSGPLAEHRLFTLDDGNKVVLDLTPGPSAPAQTATAQEPKTKVARAPAAKEPAQTEQTAPAAKEPVAPPAVASASQAGPPAEPPAPIAQDSVPTGQPAPAQAPPTYPTPKAQAPVPAAAPAPMVASGNQAAQPATSPAAPVTRRQVEEESYPLPKLRRTTSRRPTPRVRGSIPSIAPPEPLARKRTARPGAIRVAIPDGSRSTTEQVVAKVVEANGRRAKRREQQPPVAETSAPFAEPRGSAAATGSAQKGGIKVTPAGAMPAPTGGPRPPQSTLLGPKAEQDRRARELFDQAKSYLEGRDDEEAYQRFALFLHNYPGHELTAEAQYRLADAYYNLHQKDMITAYPEVMKHYQKALDLYPESDQVPWALLMMGKASMLNEEPYKALGYYQVSAEDYPNSEYAILAMESQAQALLALGRPNQALEQFREAVSRFPDSRYRKNAEWGMIRALFSMARYQRASLYLKDMMKRYPDLYLKDPELLYYLGESEFQQGNYDQARRYFLWALNIKPAIKDADIMLGRVGDTFLYEDDMPAAREIYTRVIANFPGSDGALVAKLRLVETPEKNALHPWGIFQTKVTPEAQEVYREIIKEFPGRTVSQLAQVKLAMSYHQQKRYQDAISELEELLLKHPTTPYRNEVNYTLGVASLGLMEQYKAENKPLDLMNAYLHNREFLARPNGNEVLTLLAWAYTNSGLDDRAAKLYEVLVSRKLDDPSLHLNLARTHMNQRNYQGVLGALEDPETEKLEGEQRLEAQSLQGRALRHLGRWEQAVEVLDPLVEEHPERPGAAQDFLALGVCLSRLGRHEDALDALETADKLLPKGDNPPDRLQRYLVAMEISDAAQRAGQHQKALEACQRAEKLAANDQDKAAAVYGLSQARRSMGDFKAMAADFTRLAKMKITPWSQMAARHLADIKLAPQLASVGK